VLARFERALEQAVAGSLRRVIPSELQPIQIAKAAARAMEESQVVGIAGLEGPNVYEVQLARPDYERLEAFQRTLTQELAAYLQGYANERGLRLVGEPAISLHSSQRLRQGEVSVIAKYADLPEQRAAEIETELSGTRALRLKLEQSGSVSSSLVDGQGKSLPLDPKQMVVRLGRAVDNDLVVDEASVSRYHAQLRWDGSQWLVHDLGSTNGSSVAGKRLGSEPVALGLGQVVQIGAVTFRHERR
jgi:hypothetical protein